MSLFAAILSRQYLTFFVWFVQRMRRLRLQHQVLFADVSMLASESSFSCPWPTVSCSVPCIEPRRCGHGSLSHLDYRQCWLSSCIMMVRFSFTRSSTCKSLSVMRSEHSRDVIRAAVKVSNDNLLHARLVTTCSLTLNFFMHSLKQIRTRSAIMSPTIGNLRVAAGITRFNVTNYGLHIETALFLD